MSLSLAPYNNAMRLGQGFNSYTQQICVDDAVIVDPNQPEVVVTNDGTTMRIMSELLAKPSAWNRQEEILSDYQARKVLPRIKEETRDEASKIRPVDEVADVKDKASKLSAITVESEHEQESESSVVNVSNDHETVPDATSDHDAEPAGPASPALQRVREKDDYTYLREQRRLREEIEKENRIEQRERRKEDREEQRVIRQSQREWEAQRRKDTQEAINEATKDNKRALTLDELAAIRSRNQFVERFSGITESIEKYYFDPTAAKGTSQTVIYSSKFIDRLSDITDDMSISGALSIKAAKVGGSGRGSFVDSDKFRSSDLNFYISVKVTNQTLNFKDALVYRPMDNMPDTNFNKVYGDSFISGFVEGGEFNALISMKVLNKAKMSDIKAEAKVALTAGPVDVTAEGNLGIARSNLETNTETTIQVSWSGGGHIKPMEQPWNIESIMQAAARFPDLVAECPQRTYAILTKYESLRSFVAQKPAEYTAPQYEIAQIHTNAFMDSFMSYKALYKKTGEQIEGVQRKLLEIVSPISEITSAEAAEKDSQAGACFEASIAGLSEARISMRKQMVNIVKEVGKIELTPTIVMENDYKEPFESFVRFEERLPKIRVPKSLQRASNPLSGKSLLAKPETETKSREHAEKEGDSGESSLVSTAEALSSEEVRKMAEIEKAKPEIGETMRIFAVAGTADKGRWFNNLEFVQQFWTVEAVQVEVFKGVVVAVEVSYDNGLISRKGQPQGGEGLVERLDNFQPGERVTSAVLETGNVKGCTDETRITAVRLFTNRGRKLNAQAARNIVRGTGLVEKDGIDFENVTTKYFDTPMQDGTFKGFFGCVDVKNPASGLLRIGLISGTSPQKKLKGDVDVDVPSQDYESSPFFDAQYGTIGFDSPPKSGSATVIFPRIYQTKPRLLTGIGALGQKRLPGKIDFKTQTLELSRSGFKSSFTGAADMEYSQPRMHWLTLPDNDIQFENGYFNTDDLKHEYIPADGQRRILSRQHFSNTFKNVPTVVVWFCNIKMPNQSWHSLTCNAMNTTSDYFDLEVKSWVEARNWTSARIGWVAFENSKSKGHIQTGELLVNRSKLGTDETIPLFGFTKSPKVFISPYLLDIDAIKPPELKSDVLEVTTSGFRVQYGTQIPDVHVNYLIRFRWIAVE